MSSSKGILIRNIFYMLSYAFQVLQQTNYKDVGAEEFERAEDLLAAILEKGVSQQIKQGLYREYREKKDIIPTVRGRIMLTDTMREQIQQRRRIACEFDELSENNTLNRILKTTMVLLCGSRRVKKERKQRLRKILSSFEAVDEVDPRTISWGRLQIRRNNRSYEMLMNICRLAIEGMLQNQDEGDWRLPDFMDDNMPGLYERFVREYYRQHYGKRLDVSASHLSWNLTAEVSDKALKYLPTMRTDIVLRDRKDRDHALIIDTKYYKKTVMEYYDSESVNINHLNQILNYVHNADKEHKGKTAGMLLYAKTSGKTIPDLSYEFDGIPIGIKTLDLNCEFHEISKQLDAVVETNFGSEVRDTKLINIRRTNT